jgi:TIR domain-containing protein
LAHDVFISHSSSDKAIADAVCARLEARGIRCWIAPRDVQPGRPYGEAIIDGIHNCRIMVLLLSSSANNSIHIAKEVERAVSHGATVIPLRIEAVMPGKSLDYFIGSVHWLDALTPPLEHHLDALADTILKILPLQKEPIVVGAKENTPRIAPAPSPVSPAAKKKWLIPAIVGGALLLVAVVAAVLLSGQGGNANSSTENPPGNVVDRGSPREKNAPGSDPIVGCWHWFTNAPVVINANGLMTGGPFTAQWRLVDPARRVYTFTWPEAVDSSTLSPDGSSLSGGNQYGFNMSATRIGVGLGIPGMWRWYNGVVVAIQPDGSFLAGNIRGHWRGSGTSYTLTWPKPVDTVTLSADHTRVDGSNQYGVHISGTKTGSCGGA